MNYDFKSIEANWQKYWSTNQTFKAENNSDKPKYYVLDMFPYPSGAGLHVGHPLGYIASDIYARYKRHQGFNVLHPQGYDSFGLPAEQYAIQTGQHPAITTKTNIDRYREQLDKIGFSFDWSREVRTSNPEYYKWTQWIFGELFNSWYNVASDMAEPISSLIASFEVSGNANIKAVCEEDIELFSETQWNAFSAKEKQQILLKYRIAFLADTEVNWCPELGTVLANDEIVNGVSERGGHPVLRKKMTQWSMRISAYAERMLQGLEGLDWTDSIKETQRNWIGKSVGASIEFPILSFPKGEAKAKYMTGGNNAGLLIEKAKENRKQPTASEAILWEQLRNKKLEVKFRRQHLINDFIVDFVCLEKSLVIEVDGEYHNDPTQKEKDEQRTKIINEKGFKVIRFTNEEVESKLDYVLKRVREELALQDTVAVPSPQERVRERIEVFSTRPDTIFGVSFMTLAPEHPLVAEITTDDQKAAVEAYVEATAKRSERDRMADVKTISGVFTGAYAEHPFTKEPIPIWIGDYVLASYGTGAVMAVPCGDQRDYDFAKHFNIPIPNIFKDVDISAEAYTDKTKAVIANSDFLNDMKAKKAAKLVIYKLEEMGQGKGKTNYRLRDAVFSRQRYWGEPFPIYYKDGMPQLIATEHLPISLPEVEKYLPTEDGEPPLGRANTWAWDTEKNEVVENSLVNNTTIFPLELNTMPGWAGSSWYLFRYMDAQNNNEFAATEALNYWKNVDLYIGGSEHGTGHLLYSRFWTKFLYDRGYLTVEEPFQKMINQGMILGTSAFVYRISIGGKDVQKKSEMVNWNSIPQVFVSKSIVDFYNKIKDKKELTEEEKSELKGYKEKFSELDQKLTKIYHERNPEFSSNSFEVNISKDVPLFVPIHSHVSFINSSDELDIEAFKNWRPEFVDAEFVLEDGKYIVGREVEKMSKSKFNVVNPDDICDQYGADTLRLYEMFLGPLEQSKPWNTAGITGVHNFLKKLWKLYANDSGVLVNDSEPSKDALKTLHKTIKKVTEDIENFSFNTSVSTFMICVNELTAQKCHSKLILSDLAVLISPYAPHIAEELWSLLGNTESISMVPFPKFEASHLVESSKEYPISFNGKMRFTLELPLDMPKDEIEKVVMAHEKTQKQLAGREPKKVIIVPGKIVNIVG